MQPPMESEHPVPMEYLEVNEGWGQAYGYALYRTLIPAESKHVTVHGLRDFGVVGHVMSMKMCPGFRGVVKRGLN